VEDWGGLMSAFLAGSFLPAFWPAFSPAGPTRGPWIFLRAFPPFKGGRGLSADPAQRHPQGRIRINSLGILRGAQRCAMGDIWGLRGSALLIKLKGRWKHPQRTGLASFHPPAHSRTLSQRLRSDAIACYEGATSVGRPDTLPLRRSPKDLAVQGRASSGNYINSTYPPEQKCLRNSELQNYIP
jgi:hypothetical protein